jgi:hydrogenase expression/formation protein HypC
MCLGIPGEIVTLLDDDLATVSVNGVRREVSVGLLHDDGLQVGDWVLIHVGFALSVIDQREAELTLAQIQQLGQAWDDEWQAFGETAIR